jgi:hypothetical protein
MRDQVFSLRFQPRWRLEGARLAIRIAAPFLRQIATGKPSNRIAGVTNQVGDPTEKRTIASLTDSELRFTRSALVPGTTLDVVFKRAK